jgi:hypothetical protein
MMSIRAAAPRSPTPVNKGNRLTGFVESWAPNRSLGFVFCDSNDCLGMSFVFLGIDGVAPSRGMPVSFQPWEDQWGKPLAKDVRLR